MGRISLRGVTEEEHASGGLVAAAICWEVRPGNAGYSREQTFHVELKPDEYNGNLCIGKYGHVLTASFIQQGNGEISLKRTEIVKYQEVFAIDRSGSTRPDFDYYSDADCCAVLGIGKFSLTLRSVKFKSGKGSAHGRSDSDRPDFGCGNSNRSTCGAAGSYVPFTDLDISPPIEGHSGGYGFQYYPTHCEIAAAANVPDGMKRFVILSVLLGELRKNISSADWSTVEELRQIGLSGMSVSREGMVAVGGAASGMLPVTHVGQLLGRGAIASTSLIGGLGANMTAVGEDEAMPSALRSGRDRQTQQDGDQPGGVALRPDAGHEPRSRATAGGAPSCDCARRAKDT